MSRPPPWIYPPDDFAPFHFASAPAAPVLNVELELGNFITQGRWLRVANLYVNAGAHQNNSLRLLGPGWADLADHMAYGQVEVPIFVLLPPTSQHFVRWLGQAATDLVVRFTGWYFDDARPPLS